jgi:citrate lyase beta subunit
VVRGFFALEDIVSAKIVAAKLFNFAAVEDPFAVAEEDHFEEGDRVQRWFSSPRRRCAEDGIQIHPFHHSAHQSDLSVLRNKRIHIKVHGELQRCGFLLTI